MEDESKEEEEIQLVEAVEPAVEVVLAGQAVQASVEAAVLVEGSP